MWHPNHLRLTPHHYFSSSSSPAAGGEMMLSQKERELALAYLHHPNHPHPHHQRHLLQERPHHYGHYQSAATPATVAGVVDMMSLQERTGYRHPSELATSIKQQSPGECIQSRSFTRVHESSSLKLISYVSLFF